MNRKLFLITLTGLIIDQLLKLYIVFNMNIYDTIAVIDNFFSITYVHNYGAAFSILTGNRIFFIIVTIISLFLIYKYFIKDEKLTDFNIYIFGLLFAGILGNLFDRIFHGYVIDYLDFKIFNYNFPIFNFADICIVITTIIIIIINLKGVKNERNTNN